jgi:hypothetical protein
LSNVTLVLPQDSEMSYVTYMFTLYNSPLQYFKQQTQFYSDVLHMTQLQVGRACTLMTLALVLTWQQHQQRQLLVNLNMHAIGSAVAEG